LVVGAYGVVFADYNCFMQGPSSDSTPAESWSNWFSSLASGSTADEPSNGRSPNRRGAKELSAKAKAHAASSLFAGRQSGAGLRAASASGAEPAAASQFAPIPTSSADLTAENTMLQSQCRAAEQRALAAAKHTANLQQQYDQLPPRQDTVLSGLQSQMRELQTQLERVQSQMRTERSVSHEQLRSLLQSCKERDHEFGELVVVLHSEQATRSELEGRGGDLLALLDRADAEVRHQNSRLAKLGTVSCERSSELKDKIAAATTEVRQRAELNAKAMAVAQELEVQLIAAEKGRSDAETRLASLRKRARVQEAGFTALRQSASSTESAITAALSANEQLAVAAAQSAAVAQQARDAERRVAAASEAAEAEEQAGATASRLAAEGSQACEDLSAEIGRLSNAVQGVESEVERHRHSLRQSAATADAAIVELEVAVRTIQKHHSEASQQVAEARAELQEIEREASGVRAAMETRRRDFADLDQTVTFVAENGLEEPTRLREEAKQRLSMAHDDLARALDQLRKVTEQNDSNSSAVDGFEASVQVLENKVMEADQDACGDDAAAAELTEWKDQVQRDADALERSAEALEAQVQELRSRIDVSRGQWGDQRRRAEAAKGDRPPAILEEAVAHARREQVLTKLKVEVNDRAAALDAARAAAERASLACLSVEASPDEDSAEIARLQAQLDVEGQMAEQMEEELEAKEQDLQVLRAKHAALQEQVKRVG